MTPPVTGSTLKPPPLLAVQDLRVHYGLIEALHGISLEVHAGECVALIGANGAGKTTALGAISGILPHTGTIRFEGRDLQTIPADQRVAMGLTHVPEGRGIFPNLTVHDNLRLAAWHRPRAQHKQAFERVYTLFPRLAERRAQLGGTLSGGEQQMLAIGRALMIHIKLLLLDEPSMGLAPKMIETVFAIIKDIHRQGATILLVEQNANLALSMSDRGYVLETGILALTGTGAELLQDAGVQHSYLGE